MLYINKAKCKSYKRYGRSVLLIKEHGYFKKKLWNVLLPVL